MARFTCPSLSHRPSCCRGRLAGAWAIFRIIGRKLNNYTAPQQMNRHIIPYHINVNNASPSSAAGTAAPPAAASPADKGGVAGALRRPAGLYADLRSACGADPSVPSKRESGPPTPSRGPSVRAVTLNRRSEFYITCTYILHIPYISPRSVTTNPRVNA